MHMVWVLVAMKLVSGSPEKGGMYVGVATLPLYKKVQVAVYTDQYTCQVWAQRIANLSDIRLGSAVCLAQQVN
jgi:hypothetical protein